jgi:hypothetical protein
MRLHTVLLWWVSSLLTSCAFGLELNERALGVADVIANVPPCGVSKAKDITGEDTANRSSWHVC